MTHQEFVNKYDGEGVDYDGNGKYWCVDLVRAYVEEVLQKAQFPLVVGAVNIWDLDLSDDYDKVPNQPDNMPSTGSLIIWGGRIGHVAIAHNSNLNWFTSFDQNWPVGSLSHLVDHSYTNILGWWQPKENNMGDEYGDMVWKSTQHDETTKSIWGQDTNPRSKSSEDIMNYIKDLEHRLKSCEDNSGGITPEVPSGWTINGYQTTSFSDGKSSITTNYKKDV